MKHSAGDTLKLYFKNKDSAKDFINLIASTYSEPVTLGHIHSLLEKEPSFEDLNLGWHTLEHLELGIDNGLHVVIFPKLEELN